MTAIVDGPLTEFSFPVYVCGKTYIRFYDHFNLKKNAVELKPGEQLSYL
jgi:hypothetical protein